MDIKEIKLLETLEVKLFISQNSHLSPEELILKYGSKSNLPIKHIAEQTECRRKAFKKLPTLSKFNLIYKKVSLEQASSEATANYKSQLMKGKRIIDLTGGLGIDSIHFSKTFSEVVYCESDDDLFDIVDYNFNLLGISNISIKHGDSIEVLKGFPDKHFDWLYIDPSRRDKNRRSVNIKFMKPDVIQNFELFSRKTKNICIKLAPAFDLAEALKIFPSLSEFIVISVDNECKEVLLIFRNESVEQLISAVIIDKSGKSVRYDFKSHEQFDRKLLQPKDGMYFYESDAAIRKLRLSPNIAQQYGLSFINETSDYLLCDKYFTDFPGRVFKILSVHPFDVKELKKHFANIGIASTNIARNHFPHSTEKIKGMLKLKDGGNDYLFFTKDLNNKLICIHTRKVSKELQL